MAKIVSIVGYSGSGKTTFLEGLIRCLNEEELSVAVIKHTHKEETFFTGGNKDTDRHFAAGAASVALAGPSGFSLNVRGREPSPEEMLEVLGPVDLVLTEGYKKEHWPKVEIRRKDSGQPALFAKGDLLALVTDEKETGSGIFPLDDPRQLAEFLISYLETGDGTYK